MSSQITLEQRLRAWQIASVLTPKGKRKRRRTPADLAERRKQIRKKANKYLKQMLLVA